MFFVDKVIHILPQTDTHWRFLAKKTMFNTGFSKVYLAALLYYSYFYGPLVTHALVPHNTVQNSNNLPDLLTTYVGAVVDTLLCTCTSTQRFLTKIDAQD